MKKRDFPNISKLKQGSREVMVANPLSSRIVSSSGAAKDPPYPNSPRVIEFWTFHPRSAREQPLSSQPCQKTLNISHPDEARLPRLPDSIDQPITAMPQSRMIHQHNISSKDMLKSDKEWDEWENKSAEETIRLAEMLQFRNDFRSFSKHEVIQPPTK
ncbi:hypothetical protein TNCV_1128631 [Trichonephila clavipes]|nr:hypothetical protein TNCV_1128631 [Trichonephila clavipes]